MSIKVAVIGYGLSAKIFHIPLILALPSSYTLYGVVQRKPTPDDDAAKDHAGIQTWTSTDSMLADPQVNLVVISTPPATHFPFTKASLEAGKHVVVEKPFVPTSSESKTLSLLAKEKNLTLSVYQNRRWDIDFLTLKNVVDSGRLGEIVEFETHYDRFSPSGDDAKAAVDWRSQGQLPGAGVLYDLGSHLIDQVYALYGAPKSVYGVVQVQRRGLRTGEAAPDAFTVVLKYVSDEGEELLVTAKSSTVSAGDTLRYWVRGTKGSFRKFHLDPQEDQLKAGLRPGDRGFAYEDKSHHGSITLPASADGDSFTTSAYPSVEPTTYVEYYRILADAIAGKGKVPVSADEATDVLKIIEMVQESSNTGKTIQWG